MGLPTDGINAETARLVPAVPKGWRGKVLPRFVTGRVSKFSLERLLRSLRRLDRDVAIVTRPRTRGRTAASPRRPAAA
jgi:hypothetical protein